MFDNSRYIDKYYVLTIQLYYYVYLFRTIIYLTVALKVSPFRYNSGEFSQKTNDFLKCLVRLIINDRFQFSSTW